MSVEPQMTIHVEERQPNVEQRTLMILRNNTERHYLHHNTILFNLM